MSTRIVYRRIDVRMYGDARFRSLSAPNPCGQHLWIWLLTGPGTTIIPGIIVMGPGGISERIGWEYEPTRAALQEILDRDMAIADLTAPLIFLPRALNHNLPANPNVVTSWRGMWAEIPECPLKADIWRHIRKTLAERCADSIVEAFDQACPKPKNNGETQVYSVPNRYATGASNGSGNGSGNGSPNGSGNGQEAQVGDRSPNQEQEQEQEAGDSTRTNNPSLVSNGVPVDDTRLTEARVPREPDEGAGQATDGESGDAPKPGKRKAARKASAKQEPSGFALLCRDGSLYEVPVAKVEDMRKRYPTLDVENQFFEMQNWCEDNASKRKSRRGMPAFIGNWMRRAANPDKRGPRRPSPRRSGQARKDFFERPTGALSPDRRQAIDSLADELGLD